MGLGMIVSFRFMASMVYLTSGFVSLFDHYKSLECESAIIIYLLDIGVCGTVIFPVDIKSCVSFLVKVGIDCFEWFKKTFSMEHGSCD